MDYFGSRKEIIKLGETSITCVIDLSHCYMNIALIYGGKKTSPVSIFTCNVKMTSYFNVSCCIYFF